VNRRVIATSPVAVEYSITPLGRSLQQPFEALIAWAQLHGQALWAAQTAYDERSEPQATDAMPVTP